MKASRMCLKTLKEAPQEAVIDSHILLLRSGMIKKNVAGVYTYMPLGLKVLKKIENIVREEMDGIGSEEILCSALQPKELWIESGRWTKYGPELMRLKDRNDGLPLGNDIKWLGVGWKGVERQRVEEESDLWSCS